MDNEQYVKLFLVSALIIIAPHMSVPVAIGLSLICVGLAIFLMVR